MSDEPEIRVTEPQLPSLERLQPYLEQIWSNRWLTNNGPLHEELEEKLAKFLDVENLSLVSNGTLGLILALRALHISGEVITTPYSFVATSHALHWNNLVPVFVDIDPRTLNLDPARIESAITDKTSAILPVHCYGNPCDYRAISDVADRYGLKVIYDAAHAFGVKTESTNILKEGDISVLSFHATKAFNTFEGGAVISRTPATKQEIDDAKNFGISSETTVDSIGINAKLNEFSAAMGLLQLEDFEQMRRARADVDSHYRKGLTVDGIRCFDYLSEQINSNFTYFPVFVDEAYPMTRDELYSLLRENGVHARRYFYPLISEFPMYKTHWSANNISLTNADLTSKKVLCLPIYPDLGVEKIDHVIDIIQGAGR